MKKVIDIPENWETQILNMSDSEIMDFLYTIVRNGTPLPTDSVDRVTIKEYIDSFNNEQMTAEEYRQRMVQAFYNADCCELIAVCVRPTEKEFEHLEWLLKNHYKKEPCRDAISRQEVLEALDKSKYSNEFCEEHHIDWSINIGMAHIVVNELKPVTPQPKMGRWITLKDEYGDVTEAVCSCCDKNGNHKWAFCPNCGAKMQEVEE